MFHRRALAEWWAHFEFTRINTTPTFIPKKLEDLHEAHEYMTVPNLSSADGEVDLRIRGLWNSYTDRMATIGWTGAARRAGARLARTATSTAIAAPKT